MINFFVRRSFQTLMAGYSSSLRSFVVLLMLVGTFPALAQDQTITGTVSEADGSPLPGVTVALKGTTKGANTDATGTFRIQAPATGTLVFSFVGKTPQEVAIGNKTTISVTLVDDSKSLQEVVVTGYGTQRRKDLTGSIASISSEEFQKGNIVAPEQLIAGKIAGVSITPPSGQPGGGAQIRIRGGSSLNASNEPLIIIDGLPVETGGISGASNPLTFVNPQDIETFTVLKDASATAIYGSRASNGVILITTKKGRSGDRFRVSYSGLASVSTPTKFVDVLNADEYRQAVTQFGNASQRALLGQAGTDTDWQRQIFRSAVSHDHNVSVTGSVNNLPYRASVGYLNQNGTLLTSNFERISGALGLSPKFFDNNLRVDVNLKFTGINNRFANEGAIGAAIAFDPTQPVYSGNERFGGFFEWVNGSNPDANAPRNPLGLLQQTDNRSNVFRSIGNVVFDYKIPFLPELRANLNLGYDISNSAGRTFVPATAAANFVVGGQNNQYAQRRRNTTAEFYFNYVKELAFAKSRVDATAGYAYQDFLTFNPTFPGRRADETIITQAGLEFRPQNRLRSYFTRINYGLAGGRYLLTFTGRADGSSRFAEENRWGFFPSGALAWNIKEEGFLKGAKALSALKLRVGYGLTGQQDGIGNFAFLPRYNLSDPTAQYPFGDTYLQTLRPEGYDRNLKWEQTLTTNVGLDYAFFDGRLSGALDLYDRQTSNLLGVIPVPAGSNLTNRILTNVGGLRNRGVEFSINTTPIQRENFNWDLGFNVTYNDNKITQLARLASQEGAGVEVGGISGGVGSTIQIQTVGFPANTFFVQRQVYNAQGQPIEGVFEDRDGSGSITPDDRYRIRQPAPIVFFGVSSQLTYRRLNAGFTLRGNVGNYAYNNVFSNLGNYAAFTGAAGSYLVNASSNVLETGFRAPQLFSEYYLQNASFLRADNITVGYNVGRFASLLGRDGSLRLNANVQNAFVITRYKGIDPEIAGGIDNNFFPRPRIFALSVNVDF